MLEALEGLPDVVRVVDDVLIYGPDEATHCRNVEAFLRRCEAKNIRLNPDKVVFMQQEVEFGGLVINESGYRVADHIIDGIKNFPLPETISDMRSFQGLLNQLSPYDEKVAQIFAPLRHLLSTKDGRPFRMTDDDIQAFETIKQTMCRAPYLAFYIPGQPVELYTDAACKTGFGFVVKQLQHDNKSWKPIMVSSRSLVEAETRYAPIESEMCALAWALRKARRFLLGAPRFRLYTDHQPLISLINKKRLDEVENRRLRNFLIQCQDYNFEAVYIKGTKNVAADSLSRHPVSRPDETDIAAATTTSMYVRAIQVTHLDESQSTLKMAAIQEAAVQDVEYQQLLKTIQYGFPDDKHQLDPSIEQYWPVRDQLSISDDGFIMYGVRLLIPKSLRRIVMHDLHAGHQGIELTKSRSRLIVYWPSMNNDLEQMCRSCPSCEEDRPSQAKEPQLHLPVPNRAYRYQSADFADVQGLKFLIIVDWYSGMFATFHMNRTDAASTIRSLRQSFTDTAVPDILYTDNGPPFSSYEMQDFLQRWGIRWISSSPYYAQGNSMAENGVKAVKKLLDKCIVDGKVDDEK